MINILETKKNKIHLVLISVDKQIIKFKINWANKAKKPIAKIRIKRATNILALPIGKDIKVQSILLYLLSENKRLIKTIFNSIKTIWGNKEMYNELFIKLVLVKWSIKRINDWEMINKPTNDQT